MLERRDTSEPMHVRTCPADHRALIRLVAAATIYSRAASSLAQVRLLSESGVYSRGASIRSYTVRRTGRVPVLSHVPVRPMPRPRSSLVPRLSPAPEHVLSDY